MPAHLQRPDRSPHQISLAPSLVASVNVPPGSPDSDRVAALIEIAHGEMRRNGLHRDVIRETRKRYQTYLTERQRDKLRVIHGKHGILSVKLNVLLEGLFIRAAQHDSSIVTPGRHRKDFETAGKED